MLMEKITLVKPPGSRNLKAVKVSLSSGEEIGEHITESREEIIIVLKGKGMLLKGGQEIRLKEGDIHYIKEKTRHNIRNTWKKEMEYVYVVNSFQRPV
jgi:quercetin dioxygenase-like cupin family protein